MPRDETRRGVGPGFRQIGDVRTLRALTHPVRVALLEVLRLGDPLTATEIGERIGETPTTCSFHLRQLAKYKLVEEAGGGKGRARPWRLADPGVEVPTTDDPQVEIAAGALGSLMRERQQRRYRTWLETRDLYPKKWRKAATGGNFVVYLTPKELESLNREIIGMIVPRYDERLEDPSKRPPGAAPVEVVVSTYPIIPPASLR